MKLLFFYFILIIKLIINNLFFLKLHDANEEDDQNTFCLAKRRAMESMKSRYNIQERAINEAKSSLYSSSSDDEEEFESGEKGENDFINNDGEETPNTIGDADTNVETEDMNNDINTNLELEDVNLATSINNKALIDNTHMSDVEIDINLSDSLDPNLDIVIKKNYY